MAKLGMDYDEDRWAAEQLVKDAFMETSAAKEQVKAAEKLIKDQKVQVKKEMSRIAGSHGNRKPRGRGLTMP